MNQVLHETDPQQGLSSQEARARAKAGLGNDWEPEPTASLLWIFVSNIFIVFNLMIFPLLAVLLALGQYKDVISVGGIALLNTLINILQEVRAKLALDRIRLEHPALIRVIRDGREQEIPSRDVVSGEILVLFGAWIRHPVIVSLAAWAGLIIGAVYALRAVRMMLHGELPQRWHDTPDAANAWRKLPYALLLAALVIFGCFPRLLTDRIAASAQQAIAAAQGPSMAEIQRADDRLFGGPEPTKTSIGRRGASDAGQKGIATGRSIRLTGNAAHE